MISAADGASPARVQSAAPGHGKGGADMNREHVSRARGRWRRSRKGLSGVVTVVAFTERGRVRRMRVSKRMLLLAGILVLILVAGSTTSIVRLFRGHVDVARIAYLEGENRSLTTLLEGQAEQLSKLKLEVVRLKEFEQSLRVVSGLDSEAAPLVGTGQGRGLRDELPRKRDERDRSRK